MSRLSFLNRKEAILRMDTYGSEAQPFLFFTNYNSKKWFVSRLEDVDPKLVLYNFNGRKNYLAERDRPIPEIRRKDFVSFKKYKKGFNKIKKEILYGNSYLCNYTCRTKIKLKGSMKDVFIHADARYKLWFKSKFVVFSPETFVKIKKQSISSYPMKGTISADHPDNKNRLIQDKKERAEHYTITDLIRNDLSMVANHVLVPEYRYMDRLHTSDGDIFQTSSHVQGQLESDYLNRIGQIIARLLPAGSITGAPKIMTRKIIKKVENHKRGFYTGICGIFDGSQLDSGVMIRFIKKQNKSYYYCSGGGLTSQSNVHNEFKEYKQKIYLPISGKHQILEG